LFDIVFEKLYLNFVEILQRFNCGYQQNEIIKKMVTRRVSSRMHEFRKK